MLKPLPNYEDPTKRRLEAVRAASERDVEGLLLLLAYFLAIKSKKRARTSLKTYALYGLGVRDFIAWAWPEASPGPRVPILKATPDDVDRWVSELLSQGGHLRENPFPLKPATAAAYLAGVRAFYRALVWARAVEKNPALEVAPPRDPTPRSERRPALPLALYRRLLDTLTPSDPESFRDRMVVRLMGDVGLRISEVEGLDVSDFDPVEEEIHVREGKGGKARTVPLPHDLAAELLDWLKVRAAWAAPGEAALFVNLGGRKASGRRLKAWTIRKRLADQLRALGTPGRYHGPHSLRHLAGTRLYRATGDLYVVAALLGHSDVSTSQVYAKMDRSRLKEAVRRLPEGTG